MTSEQNLSAAMSETPPKLFISYSWSSPEHKAWVMDLSIQLRDSGVDVILDEWDLKPGHDAFAFMEQMVSNTEITKVIMICDETYVRKANNREGGAGTEAQIVTPDLYSQQEQSKFVAVIRERDADGKAFVPAYYRSRIYIDMSDPATYAQSFEKLVRWIFDKPLYEKPLIGTKPQYLSDSGTTIRLSTGPLARRAIDALKNGRDYAIPALTEYLQSFSTQMEKFRITPRADGEFLDDLVIKNIEEFLSYRDEVTTLFLTVALYDTRLEVLQTILRFFESLLPYTRAPKDIFSYNQDEFDNFKFIIHELFLLLLGSLTSHERFSAVNYFLSSEYYTANEGRPAERQMQSFVTMRWHLRALGTRNKRLNLRRLSLRADLLKERNQSSGVEFRHMMAIDFVLFLRSRSLEDDQYWWPETLLYVGHYASHFEVFLRCRSASYFNQVVPLLGVKTKEELESLLLKIEADPRGIPRWEFDSFNPRILLGFDQLATRP